MQVTQSEGGAEHGVSEVVHSIESFLMQQSKHHKHLTCLATSIESLGKEEAQSRHIDLFLPLQSFIALLKGQGN